MDNEEESFGSISGCAVKDWVWCVLCARQNELRHGVYLFAAASINISIDIFLPFAHSDVFLVWAERIWVLC